MHGGGRSICAQLKVHPDPLQLVHLIMDTPCTHATPLLAESGHQGVQPSQACSTTATLLNWGRYHGDGQSLR